MSSNISPGLNNSDIELEEPVIEHAPSLNNSDVELEERPERPRERPEEYIEEPDMESAPKPIKRGLPKTILANQQKYLEALEKQQRMLKKPKSNKEKVTKQQEDKTKDQEKRRIIVAGRIKYIDADNNIPVFKNTSEPTPSSVQPTKTEPAPRAIVEKIPKPEVQNSNLSKETRVALKKSEGSKCSRKIPSKYAKKVEEEVKQQTIKNVKNFSDLRRIRVMQTIMPDSEMDTARASIAELRKLKVAQRKKELAELKIKSEANKKESAVQEILNNSNMSKFAKTVAIKNLSASSRHRNKEMTK